MSNVRLDHVVDRAYAHGGPNISRKDSIAVYPHGQSLKATFVRAGLTRLCSWQVESGNLGTMPGSADTLVLSKPRLYARRSIPIPAHDDDTGLLRIEACGLCGTDHEQYTGHLAPPFAFIPGHEIVGVIEALGDKAAKRWGVGVGQRVAVEVFQSCRECDACVSGLYRRCKSNGLATMYGFSNVDEAPGLFGGYATHLFLRRDSMLMPIPDGLDPIHATLFNPLGAGIRWAVTLPKTRPGDVVAILGPGIRGILSAAAAKRAGAACVLVAGLGERDRMRLDMAKRFGADITVDVSRDKPEDILRNITGTLADVVVDVTARAPSAFAGAVRLAKTGGRVVVAGTRGEPGAPEFSPDEIVYKELTIMGSLGVDFTAYKEALAMLDESRFPFADLPRRIVNLDGVEDLVKSMAGETDTAPPVHGVVCAV